MKRKATKVEMYFDDDESSDEELDLNNIDVEEEEDFSTRPPSKCNDMFLNTLCGDNDDYIPIDEGLEDSDDENRSVGGKEDMEADHEYEDEGGIGVEYCTHDPAVKWNKMKPLPGERYESPQQLKLCITNYAISNGYQLRFQKCDSVRIMVRCGRKTDKKQCPFRIWASWMQSEKSFQIKSMIDEHKCVRSWTNSSLLNPSWIARQFVKELIRQPALKCKDMQSIIQSKFHYKVSWQKCYRARCRAMSIIEGKLSEHYARVWDYAHELQRFNPGSTVKVGVTVNPDNTTYFHRMYVCFDAIKQGWKRGCRRVVGLDGCFLKGPCQGQLLTAIGRDANNQVFPIAWAVVDVENKQNWRWFLELFSEDLQLDGGRGLCVISDQHKGLLESTKEILPFVEHRQCARHIYANFRKVYNGLEFKNMFWSAATSTVISEFLEKMEAIKAICPGAYEHLHARNPETWCRAYFSSTFSCEAVENGIAECFNSIILEARKKPLITMLEEIRLYLMDRFYKMSQKVEKWNGDVCPAVVKKMTKFSEIGCLRNWVVCPSGSTLFEARNGFESYSIDLELQVCTCRLWELSGIPCVHAQACIIFTQEYPVLFISDWFKKDKFRASYATNLKPLNGSKLWIATPYIKPLPPIARRMPGRPTLKRKRHVSEKQDKYYKVSSHGRTVKCTNCQEMGHNKVSCKKPPVAPEPKEKKTMGRPRTDPDVSHWTRGGYRGPRLGSRGGGQRGSAAGSRGGGQRGRGQRGRGQRGGSKRGSSTGTRGGGHMGSKARLSEMEASELLFTQQTARDLKKSQYTDQEVLEALGISTDDLNDILATQDVPIEIDVSQNFGDQSEGEIEEESMEEMEEMVGDQSDQSEGETAEEGRLEVGVQKGKQVVEEMVVTKDTVPKRQAKQPILKRRPPSERIVKMKLGKSNPGSSSVIELD